MSNTMLRVMLTIACGIATRAQAQGNLMKITDSVVIERTRCFGTCPAYRLSVTSAGRIVYESRNGDRAKAVDSVESRYFFGIVGSALMTDFLELPDRIADDPHFCPHRMTDAPTVTVTLFMTKATKSVEDYHGCMWAPDGLRRLENYIDEVANTKRWTGKGL